MTLASGLAPWGGGGGGGDQRGEGVFVDLLDQSLSLAHSENQRKGVIKPAKTRNTWYKYLSNELLVCLLGGGGIQWDL